MDSVRYSDVVLTAPDYLGTLAATRCLGRRGARIIMADASFSSPAMWSKYVKRRERTPSRHDASAFVDWLMKFGQANPGSVLYPTTDEMAWLIACHREKLAEFYQLYSPSFDTIYTILNKQLLNEACISVGFDVPETCYPSCEKDLEDMRDTLAYPVIIKPKTQVFLDTHGKGSVVRDPASLVDSYKSHVKYNVYSETTLAVDAAIKWPMVQRFYPDAPETIYSISGFVDRTGEHFAARASVKVLQHPRRVGIGLCFEPAEIVPDLLEKLKALVKKLGYCGVFEVEFIPGGPDGKYMLIDFNPRFYNQMAFDIARQMPLPEFVYDAAVGDVERLATAVARSQQQDAGAKNVYCYQLLFKIMIGAQRRLKKMTVQEADRWQTWYRKHHGFITDPIADDSDRLPTAFHNCVFLLDILKHPRSFVRKIMLNQ